MSFFVGRYSLKLADSVCLPDNPESGTGAPGMVVTHADATADIAGANGHGWRSILVGTGVYRGGKPSHTPSTIVDDVEQGVEWAIKQEQARYR